MMILRCVPRLLSLLVLVCVLASCLPEVRKSDHGDHAWARLVVPTLFGRQPAGEAEVALIADMAASIGRERTAAALMSNPEFITHWSDLLVDLVRVPRSGDKDLSDCVGKPVREGPVTAELAGWVKANDPTNLNPPGGTFNLADLLASSIAADDLSSFIRGYLFAFASKPLIGNEITEQNRRDDLYNNFETNFLGRNSTCLTCHNGSWSATGPGSNWNRTHAPVGFFERSLLGAHSGAPHPNRVKALFRADGVIELFPGTSPDAKPAWGMQSCGMFRQPRSDDPELAEGEQASLAGDQGRRSSLFTVEKLLRSGVAGLTDGLDRSVSDLDVKACLVCGSCAAGSREPVPTEAQIAREEAVRSLFRARCFFCHASGDDGNENGAGGLTMNDDASWKDELIRVVANKVTKARVDPGRPEESFLVDALDPDANLGPDYPMPKGSGRLTPEQRATVKAWIAGMPAGAGCATCASSSQGLACPAPTADVSGVEAFAFLVGLNLTDNIWSQVMGRPLTIAHSYSRNSDQNLLLWYLAEGQFIGNGWSLRKLLAFIVASDYYNRRPPMAGDGIVTPSGGSSPYDMPMVFDPWVEQDPRIPPATDQGYNSANHPERHRNAISEAVERKPPVTLLRSVAMALDWPPPIRTPADKYPSLELVVLLGQYIHDAVPGFRGENFTALVEWEAGVATCRKPEQLSNPDKPKLDWIDRAEIAIRDYNKANPQNPITVVDAAALVKDWLLADGRLPTAERKLVAELMGLGENEAVTLSPALNDKLRDYCGVLLESAQFKLAGVVTGGAGVVPRLRVCNAGPCTYRELCGRLVEQGGLGQVVRCEDHSVTLLQRPVVAGTGESGDTQAKQFAPYQMREIVAQIVREMQSNSARFRVTLDAGQLREAQVQSAKGIAVLRRDSLELLAPGARIPPDAMILSEQGAELTLSLQQASMPVQLAPSQLEPGTIAEIARQLALLPPALRAHLISSLQEGKTLVAMGDPGYAVSSTPERAVGSALRSAFPHGSGGKSIRQEQRTLPFDDAPLKKRIDIINKMRR